MTRLQRLNVISGARSGMGRATADLLRSRGEQVIGIDLHGSDIDADLGTPTGRAAASAAVRARCREGIDTLILCAGLAGGFHPGEAVVSVNFFGAIALTMDLRDLLARGQAPRVVIVSSSASLLDYDSTLVDLCLAGNEAGARAAATHTAEATATRAGPVYAASKRALTRWIRRHAPRPEWAGAGILMNGVAPGLVRTPMTAPLLATEDGRALLAKVTPRAVAEPGEPQDIAELLAFLASAANRYMVGQVPLCDGGTDLLLRGDDAI